MARSALGIPPDDPSVLGEFFENRNENVNEKAEGRKNQSSAPESEMKEI